ncbi:MAG TPA: TonB-dependent siderophore receptor [Methylophilaceae bacterium]|jgi:catecholate siderophore receptor
MSLFKTRPVHLAVLAALVALPAAAETNQTAPEKSAEALPEVSVSATQADDKGEYLAPVSTVGGKVPTAVRDIPQTVTVINRAILDAQGSATLADALRNVPGITIGGAEGGQIGTNINLRGFSARTDIYLDGMRDRGQYYRDTYYLDAVEVLKGPSSMLFGRGSTGGVVNQVRKQPILGEIKEATVTMGTDGYYRTTADYNHQISDTAAFRLNLMAQDTSTTRDVMENQDFGIAPSLRFGIGTPTEVKLSALLQRNHDMPDYGIPSVNGKPANVSYDNYYGLTNDRTNQDASIFNAAIKHAFNDSITLRNQTQYGHYITDARETYTGRIGTLNAGTGAFTSISSTAITNGNVTTTPTSGLSVLMLSHDRKIDDRSLNNQTDLVAKFDTGFIKHTMIVGAEIGHDEYTNQAYNRKNAALTGSATALVNAVAVVSLEDPDAFSTPVGTIRTQGNRAESSANTLAAYFNDTLEFNKQWKAIVGLRWDQFRAETSNSINKTNTAGNTALAAASQNVEFTSVRSGLIYQPTDAQSYYMSYGTSFNPSLEALTLTTGQQDIAPEKSRSYEVGSKWDLLDGSLSLTSAIFRIEKTNARSLVSTGVYQNDGNVRVDGFEAGLTGRITSKWQVMAGYTYLDSEILKASALDNTEGNKLANTPRNTVLLWTTYNLTPEWEIGGGATHLSSVYASNTNVVEANGYTRYDATAAYHQPKYDLRLNVLNLTDKDYIASVIPSDGGRSVPGIGRTALATFTYRF